MEKPNIPKNEKKRLATLRFLDILDTQAEERFDRLTRMARYIFKVPIAMVSLVDENRHWFKSSIGLNMIETARETSFCGHTINGNEVFIIPNAIKDPRFADNPLVLHAPYIRFYAGCPLIVNGYKLGTLCLIDTNPRDFKSKDTAALKDLASMVEHELAAVQLATTDALTELSNRRGFLAVAQNNLNLSLRNKSPVTLVYIDLDHFKFINDNFGHAEGDSALMAFANLIKNTFRDSDLFARIGGDEFAFLFNHSSKKQVEKAMQKLKMALNQYNQQQQCGYSIAFSYGVVQFNPHKHANIEKLLCAGDKLMYESKNINS